MGEEWSLTNQHALGNTHTGWQNDFCFDSQSFLFVPCSRRVPQLCLTFAIGVTVFGGYMYYRFENSISFEYTGVSDEKEAAEALAGERMYSS